MNCNYVNGLLLMKLTDYIIIGTGKEKFFLEDSIYERFTKLKIKVDVLPTVSKHSEERKKNFFFNQL